MRAYHNNSKIKKNTNDNIYFSFNFFFDKSFDFMRSPKLSECNQAISNDWHNHSQGGKINKVENRPND